MGRYVVTFGRLFLLGTVRCLAVIRFCWVFSPLDLTICVKVFIIQTFHANMSQQDSTREQSQPTSELHIITIDPECVPVMVKSLRRDRDMLQDAIDQAADDADQDDIDGIKELIEERDHLINAYSDFGGGETTMTTSEATTIHGVVSGDDAAPVSVRRAICKEIEAVAGVRSGRGAETIGRKPIPFDNDIDTSAFDVDLTGGDE